MEAPVIIVGAGLSGLMAARTLKEHGIQAWVVDKGRSVGGRLATRRIQNGIADHGAQFFTARTPEFQTQVNTWMHQELVTVWGYGWSDGSTKQTPTDGHARYVCVGGMNALAQHLEQGLDVAVNTEIANITWRGDHWLLTDLQENTHTARHLILTPPVPQSLKLLQKGQVPLASHDQEALARVEYGPCLCGLFVVEGDVDLPEPGAYQNFGETVYWIADNQRKGISSQRVITLHVEARYSREHYDDPDSDNLAFLRQTLKPRLKNGASIIESQLKKWRYSIPLTTHPHDCLVAQGLPLVFGGDAFGGRGRVEGAYISGKKCAEAILQANPR
jgi:renalase